MPWMNARGEKVDKIIDKSGAGVVNRVEQSEWRLNGSQESRVTVRGKDRRR